MIEKINDAYVLRHSYDKDFEQSYFFSSDHHWDSVICDREQLKADFEEAKSLDAGIIIIGDSFDAMGGKYDPRSGKEDIRPEYNRGAYFDDIVYDYVDFLKPYKDLILMISDGNHETSVKKRHEIDLIERTIMLLNPKIQHGKYAGFIEYMFEHNTKGGRRSKTMYYTHGNGGNAPVTKNTIQTNRRQDMILADFYISGHNHTEHHVPRTQIRLTASHKAETVKCHHYQLGCYKNEALQGGYADHKGMSGANIGGRFLQFFYDPKHIIKHTSRMTVE